MSMKSLTRLGTIERSPAYGTGRRDSLAPIGRGTRPQVQSRQRRSARNFPQGAAARAAPTFSRHRDQVRLTGAADAAAPQSPLTLEVTFGALPAPSDTASVVRVQVRPP